METFKAGDQVRLLSGGPKMAVQSVGDFTLSGGEAVGVLCAWFNDKHVANEKVFAAASLELVTD